MPKTEFTMLAHSYKTGIDLSNYFVSRKLNGFLAMWDGGITRNKLAETVPWYKKGGDKSGVIATGLWSRRGKVIEAPKWWLDCLPVAVPLQGEIWAEDSKKTAAVCNTKGGTDIRWKYVQYVVYNYKPYSLWTGIENCISEDFISHFKNSVFWENKPFDIRKKYIEDSLGPSFYSIGFDLTQNNLHNADSLTKWINTAGTEDWEGLMLMHKNGLYQPYRSRHLLKIKPTYDYEATVIGHIDGKGKHEGRMGALILKTVWDDKVVSFHGGKYDFIGKEITFHIGGGFTDVMREWDYALAKYPIGAKIKFSFTEVGALGCPPSATFVEVMDE